MVKHYGSLSTEANFQGFLNLACQLLSTNITELTTACRKRTIVKKRQAIHYILHRKAGMRSVDVGELIGNKDHATVLYSCTAIQNDLDHNYTDSTIYYKSAKMALVEHLASNHQDVITLFANCNGILLSNQTKADAQSTAMP
jgi:hypothetical protein